MTARLAAIALGILAGLGCGGHAASPPVSNPAERPAAGGQPVAPEGADAARAPSATGVRSTVGSPSRAPVPSTEPAPHPATRLDRPAPPRNGDRTASREQRGDDTSGEDEADTRDDAPAAEVHHVLRRGQTLYSLARAYGVPLADLMAANGIHDPRAIPVGTSLVIPGAHVSRPYKPAGPGPTAAADAATPEADGASRPHGDGRNADRDDASVASIAGGPETRHAVHHTSGESLQWPLHGAITGPYGPRGKHGYHTGVDIDGDRGDAILAAAPGIVVSAGFDGQYGRRVEIDHGHGTMTLYAHADRLLVHAGEHVRAGQPIAEVGRSGNARGTHLHFEVRRDGQTVNPMPYLRDGVLLTAGVD
jgi:lipoprotein NlpD